MVDKRISDLTAATSLGDADLVPIVQGGVSKKLTGSILKSSSTGFQVGEVVQSINAPTNGTWLECGKYYPKASYPTLAAAIGDIVDYGTPAPESSIRIPMSYTVTNSATNLYVCATNGTTYVTVGSGGIIRRSTDGSTWIPSNGRVSTDLYECRYLNSKFVAVGANVTYSSNGIDWTVSKSSGVTNATSVAYGNTKYVICGLSGRVAYSSNLDDWTMVQLPVTSAMYRVIYANSQFVAVGASGALFTSPNGVTWTSRSAGSNHFYDIIYANSLFVAVGLSGALYTSADGITWTSRSAGAITFWSVTYASSYFVAVGDSFTVYTSLDGVTWTARFPTLAPVKALYSVLWNGTSFIAVGQNGYYATSADAISWTTSADASLSTFNSLSVVSGKTIAFGVTASVVLLGGTRAEVLYGPSCAYTCTQTITSQRTIAYNGTNLYLTTSSAGAVLTSADGIDWTARAVWAGGSLTGAYYLNSKFIVLGAASQFAYSTDGIAWTTVNTGSGLTYYCAAFGNSVWVIGGSGGAIAYTLSANNITTWGTASIVGSPVIYDLVYGGTYFIAATSNGVHYSTNGSSWTSSGLSGTYYRVVYANSTFIAIGASGVIATSTTGNSWTARTSGVTAALWDVAWNGSIYCAVGASGTILTSTDSATWVNRTPGDTSVTFNRITWNGTRFMASPSNLSIGAAYWTSTDGITWSRIQPSCGAFSYHDYLGGKYIAVGNNGIQASTDGFTWTIANSCHPTHNGSQSFFANIGSLYFLAGAYGSFVSTDGINFSSPRTLPSWSGAVFSVYSYAAYNGSFYLLAYSTGGVTTFYKSLDGATWSRLSELVTDTRAAANAAYLKEFVYANGRFVILFSTATGPNYPSIIASSADGVTWTYSNIPYLSVSTPINMASNGTTVVLATTYGYYKSTDGGLTFSLLFANEIAMSLGVSYTGGKWLFMGSTITYATADLVNFYVISHGSSLVSFFTVNNNYISAINSNGKYIADTSADGQIAAIKKPMSGNYQFANSSATYRPNPIRGTTALSCNPVNGSQPFGIVEFPLYSYDTSTTFFVPPTGGGAGMSSYIYAGP